MAETDLMKTITNICFGVTAQFFLFILECTAYSHKESSFAGAPVLIGPWIPLYERFHCVDLSGTCEKLAWYPEVEVRRSLVQALKL